MCTRDASHERGPNTGCVAIGLPRPFQAALFGSEREITAPYGNAPVEERQFKLFTQVYRWSGLYRKGIGPRQGKNARPEFGIWAGESYPVGWGSTGRPIGMTGEEAADETDPVTDKESES